MLFAVGVGNSVMVWLPPSMIRPILEALYSVNHMLPSGPGCMLDARLAAVGMGNSVMAPAGVILPTLFPLPSVNQTLPSGPAPIPPSAFSPPAVGTGYSVTTPAVVILPMLFATVSVNHRFPSGPAAISSRAPAAVGAGDPGMGAPVGVLA